MKKYILLTLLALSSFSLHAIEDIERLMIEKAETPQEKKAVYQYLKAEAAEKRKLAKRFRRLSKISEGGKASSQEARKEEMLKHADEMDSIAKEYESLAEKVKP